MLEACTLVVEQADDLLGAAGGKLTHAGRHIEQARVQAEGQRRYHGVGTNENLGPTSGLDRLEGQRVGPSVASLGQRAEHESASAVARLGLLEQVVDRRHQSLGRAVVGAQHMVAAFSGTPRTEVAVDVSTAEAVDRLLGVADQQQGAGLVVVGDAVEPVKDPRLLRRGVLELVDQRHRVLRQDALTQALGVGAVDLDTQGLVEPLQQVGKAEAALLAFELGQTLANAGRGMQPKLRPQRL